MAGSWDEAVDKINEMGLLPVDLDEQAQVEAAPRLRVEDVPRGRVGRHDLALFHRQLGRLVKAGVPILQALGFVSTYSTHPTLQEVAARVHTKVREGESLSGAMALFPQIFTHFDAAMVAAGESVGRLDETLLRVAGFHAEQAAMRGKIRRALAYPAFIAAVGLVTVLFMLSFVVPRFAGFFAGLGQELPLATRLLLAGASWCERFGLWVAAGGVFLVFWIRHAGRHRSTKTKWDRRLLQIPGLGSFLLKGELARLGRTLELLLRSGMQIPQALKVSIPVLDNEAIKQAVEASSRTLAEGSRLSESLSRSQLFPEAVVHLIRLGEESGKLEEALAEVAEWYEQETEEALEAVIHFLEPCMILVLGLVLGFIVISVLLPVFSLNAMIE